jgi:hypothetical protein
LKAIENCTDKRLFTRAVKLYQFIVELYETKETVDLDHAVN